MSEERLERMENMLAELIRIVGNTNAMVEELRADVEVMKADVEAMKTDIEIMKADISGLQRGQTRLEENFEEMRDEQKLFFEALGEHDIAIRRMRKKVSKLSEACSGE